MRLRGDVFGDGARNGPKYYKGQQMNHIKNNNWGTSQWLDLITYGKSYEDMKTKYNESKGSCLFPNTIYNGPATNEARRRWIKKCTSEHENKSYNGTLCEFL